MVSQDIQIRPVRPDEYEIAHRVKVQCGIGQNDSPEAWRRMYAENPAFRFVGGGGPIGWFLVRGDEVGGYVGNLLQVYQCGHRRFLTAVADGLAVLPAFRSDSLRLMATFLGQPCELLLATTCTPDVGRLWKLLGMSPLPGPNPRVVSQFPCYNASSVRRRLRRRQLPHLAVETSAGLAAMLDRMRLGMHGVVISRGSSQVGRIPCFDKRFDTFWDRWSQRFCGIAAVRTCETLSWHFDHLRKRNDWTILVREDKAGDLLGYAVLIGVADHTMTDYRAYRLADLLVLDDEPNAISALAQDVFRVCREDGVESLDFYELPEPYRRVFQSYHPKTRDALGFYYRASNVDVEQLMLAPTSAYFSLFDGNNLF